MASSLSAPGAHIASHQSIGRPSARRGISRAVLDLFSFEALFALFLFAGRFKADPRFSWVPIDITALFFGASVISGFLVLLRRNFRISRRSVLVVLAALAFVLYACLSLAWTPGRIYARQKAFYVATLTLWPLVAGALIIASDRQRLSRFLVLFVVLCGWLCLESTLSYLRGEGHFVNALGGHYLGIGRMVGLGALIMLGYALFFARSYLARIGAVIVLGWYTFILLVSGSRGPLLTTSLAAVVPLFVAVRPVTRGKLAVRRYLPFLIALFLIGTAIIVYLNVTGNLTLTLKRMRVVFRPGVLVSVETARASAYFDALELWLKAPLLGHGIGAWPVLTGVGDSRSYPHNLILETCAELGLLGVTLFVVLCIFGLKALGPLDRIRSDPRRLLILVLFVGAFLNAMISGDIPDNRVLFGVLGLMTLARNEVRSPCPRSST